MKKEVKQKWLERLRSGEIEQTSCRLGDEDGARCCLGVLCDVAVEEKVIPPPILNEEGPQSDRVLIYGVDDDSNKGVLPQAVVDWAGLENSCPQVEDPMTITSRVTKDKIETNTLMQMNDEGMTFEEIAEVIENNPVH